MKGIVQVLLIFALVVIIFMALRTSYQAVADMFRSKTPDVSDTRAQNREIRQLLK